MRTRRDQIRDQRAMNPLLHKKAHPDFVGLRAWRVGRDMAELAALVAGRAAWTDAGCLVWQGSRDPKGYGRTTWQGRKIGVHRLVCWAYWGPPPKGSDSFACHDCDRPGCVNPLHVYWGDHRSNMRDARERGRLGRGPQPTCRRGHVRIGPGADQYLTGYGILQCRECRRLRARHQRTVRRIQGGF